MQSLSSNSPINGQKPNKSPQNPTSQSNRVQSAVSNFFKTVCKGMAILLSFATGWYFVAKIVQHVQEPSLEKSTLKEHDLKEYAQYKKLANVFGKGTFDIITLRDWRTSLKNLKETSKEDLPKKVFEFHPDLPQDKKDKETTVRAAYVTMFSLMQNKHLSEEDKEVLNKLCAKSDLELANLFNLSNSKENVKLMETIKTHGQPFKLYALHQEFMKNVLNVLNGTVFSDPSCKTSPSETLFKEDCFIDNPQN